MSLLSGSHIPISLLIIHISSLTTSVLETNAPLWGERHPAGNSVPGMFPIGQSHTRFCVFLCCINRPLHHKHPSWPDYFRLCERGQEHVLHYLHLHFVHLPKSSLAGDFHRGRQSTQKSQDSRSKSRELAFKHKNYIKRKCWKSKSQMVDYSF